MAVTESSFVIRGDNERQPTEVLIPSARPTQQLNFLCIQSLFAHSWCTIPRQGLQAMLGASNFRS